MHILLADDSRATALPVIALLEQGGHRVSYARDGREALDLFQAEPPDLILMDVIMPVMDGLEATRHIKALGGERWIPLIMMTSLDSNENLVAGLEAGADDYLIKPIVFEVLTARIRSMERIAQIQSSLFGILDNVYEAIITIDDKGCVSSFNKGAERIFGYASAEVIGRNVSMLMPSPHREAHDGYLARYLAGGPSRVIGINRKTSGQRCNGEVFPIQINVTQVEGARGHQFIGLIRDLSSEEAAHRRIEFLALHDVLTSLPNRAQFNDVITIACANAAQNPCALLFLDLDGFKPINDSFGHEAGDEALITIAKRLRHTLAAQDFVGRLGGDEFVVILNDVSNPDDACAVARRLLDNIAQPMNLLGNPCRLGASIGAALIPAHGDSPTAALTAADNAMYAAKRAGKNCVLLATPGKRNQGQ
jgi:diguanylate cyclase (GGDEF)-like protein/PAS domain S-box-containing protein